MNQSISFKDRSMATKRRNPSSLKNPSKIFPSSFRIIIKRGRDHKCCLSPSTLNPIPMSSTNLVSIIVRIIVIICCHGCGGVSHIHTNAFVHNNAVAGIKLKWKSPSGGATISTYHQITTQNTSTRFLHEGKVQSWNELIVKNRIDSSLCLSVNEQSQNRHDNNIKTNPNDKQGGGEMPYFAPNTKKRSDADFVTETDTSINTKTNTKTYQISSRRKALQYIASTTALISLAEPTVSNAAVAEIDSKSGELYSPRKEMMGGGGSDLARGIKLESRPSLTNDRNSLRKINEPIQTVYETRFITYLSRFLLNYDPAASSWWAEQDLEIRNNFNNDNGGGKTGAKNKMSIDSQRNLRFAEFAESVEVGLADYFVGPYGSYASVKAAIAGLKAAAPATSSTSGFSPESKKTSFFDDIMKTSLFSKEVTQSKKENSVKLAKQGVLNLFALLKTRYTAIEEKKQLAILFSLITDARLQPTAAIQGLIGEVDNAKVTGVKLTGLEGDDPSEIDARKSCRRGGGYGVDERPLIRIDPPPSLGDEFKPAKLQPIMKPTSRILRIRVIDGGEGYTSIPKVDVIQNGVKISCDACAVLDRDGSVDSIVVLNPGFGYGQDGSYVEVRVAPPKKIGRDRKKDEAMYRTASAVADLEYAITSVNILDGGNGYILTEPPNIYISPPEEEPDWYMVPINQKTWQMDDSYQVVGSVDSMICCNNGQSYEVDPANLEPYSLLESDPSILKTLEINPLALFPCTLRPYYVKSVDKGKDGVYDILSLPPVSASTLFPSQRYSAYDPIFGGVAAKPVTKGARNLTSDEYARIALSGAVCTVIVRTALNPLELVKTKIQLQNDSELIKIIQRPASTNIEGTSDDSSQNKSTSNIGTLDMIKALVELRGPKSLFQSADITFLASVVFGSFGFGATELFRRSFSMVFFTEGAGSKGSEEITLLLAAGIACVVTSAFAAPFELLRVRSMAYVDAKPLKTVFFDFLGEKRSKSKRRPKLTPNSTITFKDIRTDDVTPLFSGFYPIVSRELPFAVIKFLAFDLIATSAIAFINSQPQIIEPVQVGTGSTGLLVSALSGAVAGLFGALVSHPADLILTLTSSKKQSEDSSKDEKNDWKFIVKDLLGKEGGVLNLYAGFPARASFFFLVIGLQFFLYDYAKTLFEVGSDDLTLVLDVFYAIRQGLVAMSS